MFDFRNTGIRLFGKSAMGRTQAAKGLTQDLTVLLHRDGDEPGERHVLTLEALPGTTGCDHLTAEQVLALDRKRTLQEAGRTGIIICGVFFPHSSINRIFIGDVVSVPLHEMKSLRVEDRTHPSGERYLL